jgi:hypothetical protein
MPLSPVFVQTASQQRMPPGFTETNYQNLSSQMINPGTLPQFFGSENLAQPMPVTLNNTLRIPDNDIPSIIRLNINDMPTAETLTRNFEADVRPKRVAIRTSSMRAWNVPVELDEMRAD